MSEKRERVKALHKQPEGMKAQARIKAGSPGSPVALPADPEAPQKKAPVKKSPASTKKK